MAESTRSQSGVVIDAVKQMLTAGTLRPGAKLPVEQDLAVALGVSRGSLREGVRALVALGILETRQGDGTYVTALDPATLLGPLGFFADVTQRESAAELLSVRRVLEQESASLAATRITDAELEGLAQILRSVDSTTGDDPDADLDAFIDADTRFHQAIAAASGNHALSALVGALTSRTARARLWRAISDRGSIASAHAEHRAIMAALSARDPERAGIRMAVHLLGVEEFAAGPGAEGLDQREAQ